ncbi:M20 aminoacylase family protein [Uliginosibacterium sp. sgz301328]|uniref:M20 aminoacylase family protein n=1 Tax=Uliginosibacterium sp. sgz301328 TaxID=3243764 RepID=UPI00359DE313
MSIIADIAARADALTAIRRDIHAHPELAFEEHRTAALVADELERCGIETHRGVGRTGVVGVLRGRNPGRCIGLRADMDALPIHEINEFAHRSRHDGCMHACGHDGHTTMLLGAAQYLAATRNFDGTVVFVFQPAEEGEGGAPAMIEDDFFERFPVDAIFGMHNWPGMPAGSFGVTPGAVMAATDRFDIVVRGRGAHAAMPHLGVDPVQAGAQLVVAAQSIVSRTVDPLEAMVVSITQFHAGEAYNAIPTEAHLSGTLRTLTPQLRMAARERLRQVADGVAQSFGVTIDVTILDGYPPTINTADEAAVCREAAESLVGASQVSWAHRPSMGAEDFAYFLEKRPGCYVWIGNGPGDGGCTLHNARYDFNDGILPLGASYWVRLVERFLAV